MEILTKKDKDELFKKVIIENPSNSFVYSQLLQSMISNRNQIVPFIGAGISMFAFNTWGGLLQDLLEQTDQSDEVKAEITELIKKGSYFEAADKLEGTINSDIFYFSLASAFSESNFVEENGVPKIPDNAAVRWIPKVFVNSRLITTNYDSVLEWAYAEQNLYLKVCTPSDDRMFMQFVPRRLFKIHGSYDSNYEDIVLTSKSYNEKYDPQSALYNNFKIIVRNSILFFIGASLRSDKTLDLLKELATELTTKGGHYCGNMHYAILHIDDNEDKVERKKELAKYKIMPILYTDSDHDSVEDKHAIVSIILEHLFDDLFNNLSKRKAGSIAAISSDNAIRNVAGSIRTEEDTTIAESGDIKRLLRDEPLVALKLVLSQNNLNMAESMIPEFEKTLPSEIFIAKVLAAIASRGSTVAAERLFSASEELVYSNLSDAQKIDVLGSLVSYCNRQDKEITYLEKVKDLLTSVEGTANTRELASIYNQFARLYFGAYTNENKDEYVEKAEEYARKAIETNPKEPSYSYNLAIILKNLNNLNGAKEAIEKCIDCGTTDPDHLALAYELFVALEDERAAEIYTRLYAIDPIRAQLAKVN